MSALRAMQNEGKRGRHSVDQWDRVSITRCPTGLIEADRHPAKYRLLPSVDFEPWLTSPAVMDRDRRLTGTLRGQTDNPKAPPGFELNNPWKVSNLPSL